MKMLLYISFAIGCLSTAACIEQDLDACPPEGGGVEIALGVEKFRTRPPYGPEELEERFSERIQTLDYLLYAGDRLIDQGRLDDAPYTDGASYVFRHEMLPFGSYRLALVANAEPAAMTGDKSAPENYFIAFRNEPDGDDHFRADLPFEVTCPCSNESKGVLRRVYGVARFRFENIPATVEAVEVTLDHVAQRMPLAGDASLAGAVTKRVDVSQMTSRAEGGFLLGTFPTPPEARTAWRIRLFGADATAPLYDRVVTDTLRIESNQLVDLTTRFRDEDFTADIDFAVDLDTTWDGSHDTGGGTILR